MMDLLRSRRSIRKFEQRPVGEAAEARLAEALLRVPSSKGRRPWEFVFVDDPALLEELSRAKPHGAAFLAGAPLAIVVCADEARCDVWVEDCSIAAFTAHLAAHELGLGSCWIQIRRRPNDAHGSAEEAVRRALGLPAVLRVLAIVAVGHPAEEKPGHPEEALDRSKIRRNRWEG
jgi:nitroreductase